MRKSSGMDTPAAALKDEKNLDEWTKKKALEVDRRLEAKERVKMGEEDAGSRRPHGVGENFERSPFLKAAS